MTDAYILKFLDSLATQNQGSSDTVGYYLKDFEVFCNTLVQNPNPTAEVIKKLKEGTFSENPKEEQPYEVLSTYASWLKKNKLDTGDNNARTVKYKLGWARTLLEVNFIPISRTVFRQLVKSPKPEEPEISPVDKKKVTEVITALDDLRLQSYSLWLASMGWRASESLSIQLHNLEDFDIKTLKFQKEAAFVNMSGKTAKTRKGKRRQMTGEMKRQIEKLLAYNYRPRTINRFDKEKGKWIKLRVNPVPQPEDKVFAPYHSEAELRTQPKGDIMFNLYMSAAKSFRKTIDRLGIGYEENGKRRKVTMHTLRRFAFTTCRRAVDEGYAKYHIGRRVHEYDKAMPEQIAEDFAKVEPFLTFFDTSAIEQKQESIEKQQLQTQSEIAGLKAEIAELRYASIRSHENKEILDNTAAPVAASTPGRRQ